MADKDNPSNGTPGRVATPTRTQWDDVAEKVAEQSTNGPWLRLAEDGDTATVAFRGVPHAIEAVFEDGRYVACDAAKLKALKAQGKQPQLRIAYNVVDLGTVEAKAFEAPGYFFQRLTPLRNENPFDEWAFIIKRKGAAGDKRTFYHVNPARLLEPDEKTAIAALPLHDLKKMHDEARAAASNGDTPPASAPARPTGSTMDSIANALQDLPFEATGEFCRALGIQKLIDLKSSDLVRAREVLERLQHEHADIIA